jgi:GGDEF domain-containing protein
MSVSELSSAAIDQSISLHIDSVGAHQAGRHVEFPAAVNEVLTSLRTLTGIPNWALTRQRSDGSLTILSPARRQSNKSSSPGADPQSSQSTQGPQRAQGDQRAQGPQRAQGDQRAQGAQGDQVAHGEAESKTATFLAGKSPTNRQSYESTNESIEPVSTRAFVLDRRKHQPVFLVDILDEERHNTFGNLVGYRTGLDLRDESPIAPADSALAGLLASMLASVLAQDRRHQLEQRAEERIAYPERDPITGCLERSAWIRLLESEALRLHRFDDEALMIGVKIDGLAALKRSHGIEAAEELRREVSYALHSTTASASLIAHLADDSYATLLCSTDPSGELRSFRSRADLLNLPVIVTVGQRLPGERSLHPAQRRAGLV